MNHNFSDAETKTSPRSTHEIKQQLADWEIVRAAAESYGTPDFASQIGLQSIRLHLEALEQELSDAEKFESGADVEQAPNVSPVAREPH